MTIIAFSHAQIYLFFFETETNNQKRSNLETVKKTTKKCQKRHAKERPNLNGLIGFGDFSDVWYL